MSEFSSNARNGKSSSSEEVPFDFEEMFFSRTNEKGIILSGNSVFQRVSALEWHELLRKPHNLIRHPDMPKAVFWLLWDTIRKGMPIGAYVKNRAKDGRYYWVFAIVTPVEGGFLSVRLKPSSELFDVTVREYASIRSLEIEKRLKADESAALLLSRLQELGFRDYGAFMSTALSKEIASRDIKTNREKDNSIAYFGTVVDSAQNLLNQVTNIMKTCKKSEYVPLNLRVCAAQLGDLGVPIGTISNNYSTISAEIKDSMTLIVESGQQASGRINEGLFLIGTARIQREVLEQFQHDVPNDGASREQEMMFLEHQRYAYSAKAAEILKVISSKIAHFQQACAEMRRLTLGLEMTRMMGKIEIARLNTLESSLISLINDLDAFQTTILDGLKEIDHASQTIQLNIDRLAEAT